MTAMIAKRSFQYRSRRLAVGDMVEINRRDERYLRALGWIGDAPAPVVVPVVDEPEDDESPKKRAYKRRDMAAEE